MTSPLQAMLGKEPNQALDAVKQEASEHRIHVGAGEVDKANLREHRGEEGRHEHDEDAVHNAADDQATATADSVAEDACSATSEEVRHDAGDYEVASNRGDEHADDGADGGEDAAEDDAVRSIGEQHGAVQSGLGARDELHRDALEGRHDVVEELTDAHHQDVEADDEGAALEEGLDNEVEAGRETKVSCNGRARLGTGDCRSNDVERQHDGEDSEVRIVQEVQLLGNLHVLGGVARIANELGNTGGNHITNGAEVTKGNVIAASNLANHRLSDCRHEGCKAAANERGEKNQGQTTQAKEPREDNRERGLPKQGLAGQEDVLELGEPSDDQVHNEDAKQDDRNLGAQAKVGHCLAVDALDRGNYGTSACAKSGTRS